MCMLTIASLLVVTTVAPCPAAGARPGGKWECRTVSTRLLPTWARTGFHGSYRARYELGRHALIAAIMFTPTLGAGPGVESNKILWVSRPTLKTPDDLVIVATHQSGTEVTLTVPGGPGPSGIGLPKAGCWHLDLSWSGHRDQLALRFR
jgi:hypothetical protein